MAERCIGTNKSGKPCSAKPLPGSDLCPWHDPSWAERRKAWSIRGGHGKSNKARAAKQLPAGVMTTDELRGLVGLTIKGVLAGRVEPGLARAVFDGARSYVTISEAAALERLEERLVDLERLAARGRLA